MLHRKPSRFFVGCERLGKIVQTHEAHGDIMQSYSQRLRILFRVGKEIAVGSLITFEGLRKSILPVKNVAGVEFHSRQAPLIPLSGENLARLFDCGKGAVVLSGQDQGLYGGIQGARKFCGAAQFDEDLARHFVVSNGRPVLTRDLERIAHSPKTLPYSSMAAKFACNCYGEFSQYYRSASVDPCLFTN